MAPTCFSGCASQYRALPELFKGNRGCWRGIKKQIGEAAHAAPEPEPPSDGRASAVPQLSCPGLISRSQSAVSSDAHVSVSDVERPTLLRSAKALSPQGDHEKVGEKIGSLPVSPRDIDSSLAALTTATSEEVDAHEDAGSPTQNPWPTFGCCNAVGPSTAPRSPQWDSDWMWHASAQVGSGLWTGSKQAALFLGSQLHSAATDALQSAAAETMEGIRALGPRRPRASRASLTNGKRRGDLQPPLLVAPILPPLPELNAFAPEQPWSSIAGMAGMAPGPGLGYPGPGELPVLLRVGGHCSVHFALRSSPSSFSELKTRLADSISAAQKSGAQLQRCVNYFDSHEQRGFRRDEGRGSARWELGAAVLGLSIFLLPAGARQTMYGGFVTVLEPLMATASFVDLGSYLSLGTEA
eukprot:s4385_g6.t1